MANDKNRDYQEGPKEGDFSAESSTRARNRTVMLTPEITGQVRARLQQEMEGSEFDSPPRQEAPAPAGRGSGSGGFSSPVGANGGEQSGGMYVPAGRGHAREEAPPVREPARAPARQPAQDGNVVWTKETPIVGFL